MTILSNCGKYEVKIEKDVSGVTFGYDIFEVETSKNIICSDGYDTEEEILNDLRELNEATNYF